MKISELEQKIFDIEGFRVVFRGPADQAAGEYSFQRAAMDTWTINEWIAGRLDDNQKRFEIVILNGKAKEPQRNTRLNTVRDSYK